MRLVQKVGRRVAETVNLKGLHRLGINDYLFTFFFLFGVINVVDYFLCLYSFIKKTLLLCNGQKVRGAFWIFTACQI